MSYYLAAILAAMLLCRQQTVAVPLANGTDARCFSNWKKAFLALLPLTLLAVFRWNVGVDSLYGSSYWNSYQYAAQGVNWMGFEVGFYWLLQIFSKSGVPFFWFLFALALAFMFFTSVAISRGSVWAGWSILVFFLLSVYFDCYSSLRQSLAESVCLIGWAEMGYQAPSRKRDIRVLLIFALASFLHTTALLCIPLYLVCKVRLSRAGLFKALVTAILATPFLQTGISLAMQLLTSHTNYTTVGFARINAVFTFLLAAVCWYFYDEICELDENAYMYMNQAICIFVLILNSGAMYLPYRVFDMLKICYIFIIPYLLRGIKSGRTRMYGSIGIFLILGALFFNQTILQDSYVLQYQTVFQDWAYITHLP